MYVGKLYRLVTLRGEVLACYVPERRDRGCNIFGRVLYYSDSLSHSWKDYIVYRCTVIFYPHRDPVFDGYHGFHLASLRSFGFRFEYVHYLDYPVLLGLSLELDAFIEGVLHGRA